jgi:uncharacterized protein
MRRFVTKRSTGTPITPIEQRPLYVPGAFQFDTVSRRGNSYRIFIHEPPVAPPKDGFPVLYLLDGNANFTTAVATVAIQTRRPEATGVPASVIVGIGYPTEAPLDIERRKTDYTPHSSAEREGGGAEFFSDFVETELKPVVEALVPIDRNRQALFGHSFGGLFTLWSLFTRPGSFQSYMAASPSIWWGDRTIITHEEAFVGEKAPFATPLRLLLTAGSLEGSPPMPGSACTSTMAEEAAALASRLRARAARGLDVRFAELADETHVSIIPASISRSVRFAWSNV